MLHQNGYVMQDMLFVTMLKYETCFESSPRWSIKLLGEILFWWERYKRWTCEGSVGTCPVKNWPPLKKCPRSFFNVEKWLLNVGICCSRKQSILMGCKIRAANPLIILGTFWLSFSRRKHLSSHRTTFVTYRTMVVKSFVFDENMPMHKLHLEANKFGSSIVEWFS